jgi:hypothetical protein
MNEKKIGNMEQPTPQLAQEEGGDEPASKRAGLRTSYNYKIIRLWMEV